MSCKYKPFHNWADSGANEADQTLYKGLLSICLSQTSDEKLEYAYWELFEIAGNSDKTVSEICDQKVSQYIQSCLLFLPGDLYSNYMIRAHRPWSTYVDIMEWLKDPSVFDEATNILNGLPKDSSQPSADSVMPIYDDLFRTFRKLMERLSREVWYEWDEKIDAVSHSEWNDMNTAYPEARNASLYIKWAYRRFLVSWILFQKLITDSKELFRKTYQQLMESPAKRAIASDE